MSDTLTASRTEPNLGDRPVLPAPPPPDAGPVSTGLGTVTPASGAPTPILGRAEPAASTPTEQLSRLEDKTARIEEKLARSEAATQRVVDRFEAASHRMSEVAQQTDLLAVKGEMKFIARRVKGLPGVSGLILSSVITAVLTAILTVVIIRYLPSLTAR